MGNWAVRVMSFDVEAGALGCQSTFAEAHLATMLSLFEMMSERLSLQGCTNVCHLKKRIESPGEFLKSINPAGACIIKEICPAIHRA